MRIPVLMLGCLTLALFFFLARRLAGPRVAVVACSLLAADTTYLLTTCFDWGPVVLQRLLGVAGVLCLVRFYDTSSRLSLGAGFFLFGLGLWDTALFGWTLIGLAVACLLIGAYPLARYNQRYQEDPAVGPRQPRNLLERFSVAIDERAGRSSRAA